MSSSRSFVPLLLAASLAAGCVTTPVEEPADPDEGVDAAQLISTGDEALRKGDLEQAQIKYALAVERDPDNVEALYRLGVVHNQQGSLDVAQGVLRRALQINERHQGSLETLGIVMLKRERFDDAERILSTALERRPDAWEALDALGVINDMQGDHEQAQEYLTAAAFIVPRSAKVANNLGYSHYLAGDFETAERHFRDAVRFDPTYVHAWSNLGLVLSRQGRQADATAAFSKVVEEHQAANNLGYLGLLQDDQKLAREQLTRAIELSPSYYAIANRNLESLNSEAQRRPTASAAVRGGAPAARDDGSTGGAPARVSSGAVTADVPQLTLGAPATPSGVDGVPEATPVPPESVPSAVVATRGQTRVLTAQRYLGFLGFPVGTPDGQIGSQTVTAIRAFQSRYGLDVDGQLGPRTRRVLDREAVLAVQRKLQALGYDPGTVDGQLGGRTRAAIRQLQSDKDLPADGRLDGTVLEALSEAVGNIGRKLNSPDALDSSARG